MVFTAVLSYLNWLSQQLSEAGRINAVIFVLQRLWLPRGLSYFAKVGKAKLIEAEMRPRYLDSSIPYTPNGAELLLPKSADKLFPYKTK